MNILFITKNYPPVICGVGDHSFQLKNEWEKMGHRVWIISATENTGNNEEIINGGEFGKQMQLRLPKLIAELQIDLLFWQYVPYSYQQKGLPFWWPRLMKKISMLGVRQRIFFHEVSLRRTGDGLRQSLWAILQQTIARAANQLAEQSFTSNQLYQSYFRSHPPAVVPVGTNLPVLQNTNTLSTNNVVCFANRADEALFRAVKELRAVTALTLTICGSLNVSKKKMIEHWIDQSAATDWLQLTGTLSAEELATYIGRASIFIQPQITDKYGRGGVSAKNGTIMAAMSLARPIITCRGDMTDPAIFQDQVNMLFVPYGNSEAYKSAIQLLLEDQALAERLGKAAADTFHSHATWPLIAAALIA